MEIVDFYNQGVQVQVPTEAVNMTHSFTATGTGEPKEIGYVPKSNSKKVEGPAHDIIEHDGKTLLALKEGHVYSVTLLGEDADPDNPALDVHTISAEEGHVLLPLPDNTIAEVVEYDPTAEPETTPEEQSVTEADASEGKLGDDEDAAGDDENAADEEE